MADFIYELIADGINYISLTQHQRALFVSNLNFFFYYDRFIPVKARKMLVTLQITISRLYFAEDTHFH